MGCVLCFIHLPEVNTTLPLNRNTQYSHVTTISLVVDALGSRSSQLELSVPAEADIKNWLPLML